MPENEPVQVKATVEPEPKREDGDLAEKTIIPKPGSGLINILAML